jgi:hypothetical protein
MPDSDKLDLWLVMITEDSTFTDGSVKLGIYYAYDEDTAKEALYNTLPEYVREPPFTSKLFSEIKTDLLKRMDATKVGGPPLKLVDIPTTYNDGR